MEEPILTRSEPDDVHEALRRAIEISEHAYLWHPSDGIDFVPMLLPVIYGDGRALFALATINSRPAYYVIRGDSGWACGMDRPSDDYDAPDFAEFTDEIYTDLEEHFGSAERDDEDSDEEADERAGWPAFDYGGGCSWGRMDWPALAGLPTSPNPRHWRGDLLDIDAMPSWEDDGGRCAA